MDYKVNVKKQAPHPHPHPEDRSPTAYGVFQEACRVAGEALQTVYPIAPSPSMPPRGPSGLRHRRAMSENLNARPKRPTSFQKWKNQMQKVWRWGGTAPEDGLKLSFNPEILANQKRQWTQLQSKTPELFRFKEPTSIFEHFIVAGLSHDANLEAVEDAFARRKRWEHEMQRSDLSEFNPRRRAPPFPAFEPQMLFKYPPGKKLPMRVRDLAAFCFPSGVKARLLERTPSLSELNELVYGQEHLGRDDLSFVFSLKVVDNATLYGICLLVPEIVQRSPGILGKSSPLSQSAEKCCRFLVSAHRCYCVLTRVPFFELHYEMLNSIIAQERLNRITEFMREMSINEHIASASRSHDGSPERDGFSDWMASAIPVSSAITLAATAAGIVPDDEVPFSSARTSEPQSPESNSCSEASDFGHVKEFSDPSHIRKDSDLNQEMEGFDLTQERDIDKDSTKSLQFHDCVSEVSETQSEVFERISGSYENGLASPETAVLSSSKSVNLDHTGASESILFSPARSLASDDDGDDEGTYSNGSSKDFGDELMIEWARETNNELLQIVCAYHAQPLPLRGGELVFQPLEHLQAIMYRRPPLSSLVYNSKYLETFDPAEVNSKLAAAEEALALSLWTTATTCRVLSLQSILALVTGVLLEKQIVIVCPNLGVLSATVLSIVPIILPFQWQSLLLPVLPAQMFDFLDAPVPYIVGIQNKISDMKLKASNLVHVNIPKDQMKTCHLPALPRYKDLYSELGPIHARLAAENGVAKRHPVNRCNDVQAHGAIQFLTVMRRYLESVCQDMRAHTITCVQGDSDRVSFLLKDSFIDSFPTRDRLFVKQFLDTQLFTVLSDTRISGYENGHY